jgi:cell division protein ZapA
MAMAEDVEVEIFGQIFHVAAGDATPAYIQRLAYYVDEKMRAIAAATKAMSLNRIAILTALNIADDLFKLRDSYEQSARLVDAKTEQLISLIREQLSNE